MKKPQPTALARASLSVLLAACASAPQAQTRSDEPEPRTWFELQGLSASIHSSSRADGLFNEPAGTVVQHEADLAQPGRSTVPSLAFGRRVGVGWRVLIDYTQSERQADTVLARDIQVGGYRYAAGSAVHAAVGIRMLRVLGFYSLVQAGGGELGVGIGGMGLRVARRIEARAGSGGVTVPSEQDDIGLVPQLGAIGTLEISPALQLSGRLDASLGRRATTDLALSARWRLSRHFSLGLGWREARGSVDTELGVISGVSHLVMDYRLSGPQLFMRAGF